QSRFFVFFGMTKTLGPSLTGEDARPPLKEISLRRLKLVRCRLSDRPPTGDGTNALLPHGVPRASPRRTPAILARAAPPRRYPNLPAERDQTRQHSAGCSRAERRSRRPGRNRKLRGSGQRRLGVPVSCPCSLRSNRSSDLDTARSTRLDRPCGPRRSRHLHWKKPWDLTAGNTDPRSQWCIPCNREPNSIPYADAERGSRHRDSYRQRLSNCNECRTCVIRSNAAWQLRAAKPVLRGRRENP